MDMKDDRMGHQCVQRGLDRGTKLAFGMPGRQRHGLVAGSERGAGSRKRDRYENLLVRGIGEPGARRLHPERVAVFNGRIAASALNQQYVSAHARWCAAE